MISCGKSFEVFCGISPLWDEKRTGQPSFLTSLNHIVIIYVYIYIYIYIIKHRLKYFHVLERFCDYSYTYFSFLNCKINYIINFFHKGDKDLTTNNIITLFLRLQRIFSGLVDGFALGLFLAD